jgi:ABC-type sugar transport system substrate-binding protein
MMKYRLRSTATAGLIVVALAFAVPAGAAQAKQETKKEVQATRPSPHSFTGEVTALDAAGKSLSVKNHRDETKGICSDRQDEGGDG